MRILLLLYSLALTSPARAQLYSFQFDWKKVVHPFGASIFDNTYSHKIAELPGVGFIWVGQKTDNSNAQDLWIQKIDYDGNVLWDTTFGGDFYETPKQLRVLSDGSFIVLAQSGSTNISISWHWDDVVLIKYSASGHLDWWKRYGSPVPSDDDLASDVQVCQDGGFVVTGGFPVTNAAGIKSFDAWIFKTNAQGTVQWNRIYSGSKQDVAQGIVQTPDGGYAVAASSASSDGDFNQNSNEIDSWLLKLDQNGWIEWKKHYGGKESENLYFIEQTSDGGFILSGEIEVGSNVVTQTYGGWDVWVCRVTGSGDLLWSKNFGGSNWDAVRELASDGQGKFWHAGFTLSNNHDICRNRGNDDFWVFAVDMDGNLSWSQTFGGSGYDEAQGICCVPGGFIVCGNANSKDGDVGPIEPYQSGWLVKVENPVTFNIDFPVQDTTFCGSGSITLDVGLPDSISAQWNTGQNGHQLSVDQSGVYSAIATLYGCSTSDTLSVGVIPAPKLRSDTLLCFRDSLLLTPDLPVDKILWNTGSEEKAIWARNGIFSAAMQVQECVFRDSVSLRGKWCDEENICLPVPNAFTPNGDGANDTFGPVNSCEITPLFIQLEVFNRWGEKVFRSAGADWPYWDGRDQPSDVYVWRLLLSFEATGELVTIPKIGEVTLIR